MSIGPTRGSTTTRGSRQACTQGDGLYLSISEPLQYLPVLAVNVLELQGPRFQDFWSQGIERTFESLVCPSLLHLLTTL